MSFHFFDVASLLTDKIGNRFRRHRNRNFTAADILTAKCFKKLVKVDTAVDELSESRVIGSGNISVSNISARMKSDSYNLYSAVAKKPDKLTAKDNRLVCRLRLVFAGSVKFAKLRSLKDNGRINSSRVGLKPNQLFCRLKGGFVIVTVKPRHHLNTQFKAVFFDKVRRILNILCGVSSFV